jgi:NTP pyrophosphatase (non-canonical NTP hydrolase)
LGIEVGNESEVMDILQEECAEVIQAVSKIRRFGFESRWPDYDSPSTKEQLETELGDLLAMIDILIESAVVSDGNINEARAAKKEKLKVWSSIYEPN